MTIALNAAVAWEENYPLEFETGRLGELHIPWDVEFVRKGTFLRQPRTGDVSRFHNCFIISIARDSVSIGIVTLTNPSSSNRAENVSKWIVYFNSKYADLFSFPNPDLFL